MLHLGTNFLIEVASGPILLEVFPFGTNLIRDVGLRDVLS